MANSHWWSEKEVTFEVKNGAYKPETILQDILNVIKHGFVFDDRIDAEAEEGQTMDVASYMKEQIGAIELLHYYLPDGRKITKPIKRILSKVIKKSALDEKYPVVCNLISQLYSPKYNLKCYFGDMSRLGSGDYEGERTCFRDGGISDVDNSACRRFLEKYVRTECLLLKREDDGGMARCIAYFSGGRNIYLTNFYFNGLTNNSILFIEGIRNLFHLPKVTWSFCNADVHLPIYLNGNASRTKSSAIHILTDRSFDYPYTRKFPCPWCGTKVNEDRFFHTTDGSTHLLGCCRDCAETDQENDEPYAYCDSCSDPINDEGDAYYIENRGTYVCRSCYEEYYTTCNSCDDIIHRDRAITDNDGNDYCTHCATYCRSCDEVYLRDDLTNINGRLYCNDCAPECKECGERYPVDDLSSDGYCDACMEARTAEEEAEAEVV